MKSDSEKVKLFKNEAHVFLVNTSEVAIDCLVYSTFSTQINDDDAILHSSQPFYRIEDIPARSYLTLENIESSEDGSIHYIIEKITWTNGLIEEKIKARPRTVYGLKRTGTIDLNTFTKNIREKVLIKESTIE